MRTSQYGCPPAAFLGLIAGLLPLQPTLAAEPKYPEVNLSVLASAKVALCKGFAKDTLMYYMQHRMAKEYETYTRATEFDGDQKSALEAQALSRMREEAASQFDPSAVYLVPGRGVLMSEFKRAPEGFEARLPSRTTFETTYFTRMDGRKELIDPRTLHGLRDVLDGSGSGKLPYLELSYGLVPSDADALQEGTDHPGSIFVPAEEARARKIVAEFAKAGMSAPNQRRGMVDLFVRIQGCKQESEHRYALSARVIGFDLYTAKLTEGFLETAPSWKRLSLIMEWRSPAWQGHGG